jgi:hypothetical protein
MTGTVVTQMKAIAFERDIERLTEGFTGREWVFEEIDRWLQQDNERFFILTGEPGVGKSAIAARLTQLRHDIAAYHFCIAGRSGTIEPNNVLLSLAAQLIEYFPGYAEALVNSIKPLRLSVSVEITIESIKDSTVQGVVINNLHTQNPQEALNIVLRQSLAALPNPPEQRQLILIDSLDEAVTFSDRDNLVTLLAGLEDLPPWVCLLLTSRPEDRVLVEFEPLEPHRIEEMSVRNLADIREYVEGRVEQPALQDQISKAALGSQTLIDEITKLSSGNFLYTKLLLNDIEAGRQSLDDLSALPKSIDDIYLAFLRRFKPQEWRNQYQPILGTLTVTQEPVTEDELANFTGIRPRIIRQDLGIVRQFLDVTENDDGDTTYAMFHQSLRDYLLNKKRNKYFWCDAQEQHELIIEYYEKVSNSWRQLREIDRYGLHHLAQHLVKADYVEKLHGLLAMETPDQRNAWFDAKEQIEDTGGFLADVTLAWMQVDEEFKEGIRVAIGLQFRYALVTASLNSLANNIPASLLVELVKGKAWSLEKALVYTRQIPDLQQKADTLIELINEFAADLSEASRDQILLEILKLIQIIGDEDYRIKTLRILIPHLISELLPQALEIAQTIQNEYNRTKVLVTLESHLPEALLKALRDIQIQARKGPGWWLRVRHVNELVSMIPARLLPKALEVSHEIEDEGWRSEILKSIALHWTSEVAPQTLEAIQAIQGSRYRDEVLKELIPYLTPELLPRIIDVGQGAGWWEDVYSSALTVLAPHLTPELMPRVLDAAQAIQLNQYRAIALTALVPYLPEVLPEALKAAQSLQSEYHDDYAKALAALVPYLPEVLPEALKAAQAMRKTTYQYLDVLKTLAPYEPEALATLNETLAEVLENIQETKYDPIIAEELEELVPYLTLDTLPQVFNIAHTIAEPFERAQILIAVAPRITLELLPKALEFTQTFRHEQEKYSDIVINGLISNLTVELLPKTFEVAQELKNERWHTKILAALAPYLTPELVPEAFKIAQLIKDISYRIEVLTALAPYLPEALLKALELVQAIGDEFYRDAVLGQLVMYLSDPLSKAFEFAQVVADEYFRTMELTLLIPYLPEALPKALEAAQTIADETRRVKALIALVPHSPEALPEALETAQTIADETRRIEALIALAPHSPEALPEALETAQTIANETHRIEALIALAPHLPPNLLLKVFIITKIIKNENHRAQLLEVLAPYLSPELLPEALEIIQEFQEDSLRSRCLCALSSHLTPELFTKALEIAISMEYERYRAETLTALFPHLTSELLPIAIEVGTKVLMQDDYLLPFQCLFVPYLPLELLSESLSMLLNKTLLIQNEFCRVKALNLLASHLPEAQLKALEAIQLLRNDLHRTRFLIELAPSLTIELLLKAIEIAQIIKNDYYRFEAMLVLIPLFPPEFILKACELAQTIQEKGFRLKVMNMLVDKLLQLSLADIYYFWQKSLRSLCQRSRNDLLNDLFALVPAISVLGGEEAIAETIDSIQCVTRWWA